MGLITAPGSPPMSIVWSAFSTGDRLQQVSREKHPSKTYDGASYANQRIGDGAERFAYDFGNTNLASKVNAQEVPGIQVLAS